MLEVVESQVFNPCPAAGRMECFFHILKSPPIAVSKDIRAIDLSDKLLESLP